MNANITLAQEWIAQADAILIGASNGLSIAEGYHIFANNEMFRRQFGDMQQQYGFRNVVEGLYFQYPTAEARIGFLCCRLYSTMSDHLSPTRARTLRIGQSMNNASLMSLLVCSFFIFLHLQCPQMFHKLMYGDW